MNPPILFLLLLHCICILLYARFFILLQIPANYTKWTNFIENLTPLDSSHLKVFLGIFWEFFIFLNSNLNFEFGPVWYRPKLVNPGWGSTNPRSFPVCRPYTRTVTNFHPIDWFSASPSPSWWKHQVDHKYVSANQGWDSCGPRDCFVPASLHWNPSRLNPLR